MEASALGSEERRTAAPERSICRKQGLIGSDGLEELNEMGETPVTQAAADGEALHVKLLLEAGANVLTTNKRHQGPLSKSSTALLMADT